MYSTNVGHDDPGVPTKKLETERLILRPYEEKDLHEYHRLFSDKKNMYYLQDIIVNTIEEAAKVMSSVSDRVYTPNPENVRVYDKLFAEYKILHDYFGRGENDVMKRLKEIKASV